MIAAVMQPYFFPYIGYFQLIHAVDTFVIFDDVQYIDRGWVNRNKIFVAGKPCWLTMPAKKASHTLTINQRYYLLDEGRNAAKAMLRSTYARYPAFDSVFPFLCELLEFSDGNIARYNANLLVSVATRLGISTKFVMSSEVKQAASAKAEGKIIDLCQRVGANSYINPIGGRSLYNSNHFHDAGLTLSFLQTMAEPTVVTPEPYYLSIIDELMRRDFNGVMIKLNDYELLHE